MLTQEITNKVTEEFNFSVDKFPLSGPDNMQTDMYGLFRSGELPPNTKRCVVNRSVTSAYVPHTTDDVLALVEAAATSMGGDVNEVQCHFDKGHYVAISPSREHRESIYGQNDNIFPRIMIQAGYNGKSFRATMGFYRDACENMAMMRMVKGTSVSIRHTGKLRENMEELIEDFNLLSESWATLVEVAGKMQSKFIEFKPYFVSVYGEEPEEDGAKKTIWNRIFNAVQDRVKNERLHTGRGLYNGHCSLWEAYNGIQGYVQHDATRRGNPSDFARMLKASDDPKVKLAEAIAIKLISE